MADDLFGWDLTYKWVEKDLSKKEDLLIAFTHWFIVKSGFSCIGNGESKTIKEDEVRGETLEPGWNQNDNYNIRYVHGDKLYLLRASITGDDIIINFLKVDDLSISSCVFKINETVQLLKGPIDKTIPDYRNVLSVLRKELIDPVFTRTTHSVVGTQTTTEKAKSPQPQAPRIDPFSPNMTDPVPDDPLSVPVARPHPGSGLNPLWNNPLRDPNAVGRSDLDPFSQGIGGGMLFDPLNPRIDRNLDPIIPGPSCPRGLPRGAVPPGARFDPFGPPGTGRRGSGSRRIEPDPDHLPPPGYDDMFIDSGSPESTSDPRNGQRGRGRGRGRGVGGTEPGSLPLPGFNDPYL